MNISSEKTEKVLDLIYDAATENDLWRSALTVIADMTRSQGGILYGLSFGERKIHFEFNGRLDEECNRVFQERHMQNPWADHMLNQPVGRLVLSDEAIDLSVLRTSAFYDEVLRPQDVAHNGMMALAAREDFRAAFNICRSAREGPFGVEEWRLLQWLTPHLRRSMVLGFRLDAYRVLQRMAFDALDRFSDGVVVLDRRSRVVFANSAARDFEVKGVVNLRRLVPGQSPAHSQRLGELVRAALQGSPGGTMSLPRGPDGQLLTIIVSSIRGRDIERLADGNMRDAAVLLFIIDPANRRSIPVSALMDAYGLTQAEARVALAASSGNTVAEAAHLLGLSPNTIKTHLRRVFAKTATGRQAELAALIASVGAARIPEWNPE